MELKKPSNKSVVALEDNVNRRIEKSQRDIKSYLSELDSSSLVDKRRFKQDLQKISHQIDSLKVRADEKVQLDIELIEDELMQIRREIDELRK
jgi:Na+/phosphate symporter